MLGVCVGWVVGVCVVCVGRLGWVLGDWVVGCRSGSSGWGRAFLFGVWGWPFFLGWGWPVPLVVGGCVVWASGVLSCRIGVGVFL